MIKISDGDGRCLKGTKFVLSDGITLDTTDILPIDLTDETAIVSQNVSINELGKELLRACGDGDVPEIRDLMSRGAPFTADWLGTSPLHLAAQNNYLEVCEILLRAGISRDARTKVDRTPLHIAAYEGHIQIVECLLKHGADYDCRDMLHMSPLHWAAQNGHAEVVALLIRYGASTTLVNKFDLTAVDLAVQIKRQDIVEIIRMGVREPMIAAQHLQLEMATDSNEAREVVDLTDNELNATLQANVVMDDVDSENSIDPDRINITQAVNVEPTPEADQESVEEDSSMSESIKYLQEHGITLLPQDDSNILSTVMETGHSVVLTEVGKQVLNSIKQSEPITVTPKTVQTIASASKPSQENAVASLNMKKVITITPAEYLAMTNNGQLPNSFVKQNKLVQISKNNVKRIVMKKSKTVPVTAFANLVKADKVRNGTDFEIVKKQLAEALGQIEEYKIKLRKKEAEAEKYRQQLKLILSNQ